MAIPLPHNKYVLIGLVGLAVALGLYLRSRSASTDATDTTDSGTPTNSIADLPDDSSAYDPYSGSYTTSGGGNGTGDSQYPYPAGGPPIVIRLIPPKHSTKTTHKTTVKHPKGAGKPPHPKLKNATTRGIAKRHPKQQPLHR